jgi:DNA ligase (NAD+)
MGKKSAENLVEGIAASRSRGLARLLNGLGIRHDGPRVATILTERFGSIERLAAAGLEDLSAVDEIGPVIAESVHGWIASDYGRGVIDGLRRAGVSLEAPQGTAPAADGPLVGKTLVVTGTLDGWSREQAEEAIKAAGGRASASVSKKTDWLVAGRDAGSKLEKARKLGVAVIDEAALGRLLAGAAADG